MHTIELEERMEMMEQTRIVSELPKSPSRRFPRLGSSSWLHVTFILAVPIVSEQQSPIQRMKLEQTREQLELHEERLVRPPPIAQSPKPIPFPPKFLQKFPESLLAPSDGPFAMTVTVTALPAASFIWYINGFEVRESESVRLDSQVPNTSQATFMKPKQGEYRVTAKNEQGTATMQTLVTVYGK